MTVIRSVTSPITTAVGSNVTAVLGSLLDGLVAWWSLDETSGNRADLHGSNTLTDNNTVGFTTGKISNAADFVAANDESLSSSSSTLRADTGDLSVAGWVKIDAGASVGRAWSQRTPSAYGGAGAQGWEVQLEVSGGNAYLSNLCMLGDGLGNYAIAGSDTATGVADDTWFHLATVIDRTNDEFRFYVNGNATPILTIDISSVTGPLNGLGAFCLGGWTSGFEALDGSIDEVGVWSRALTTGEIAALYNSGNGITYPG